MNAFSLPVRISIGCTIFAILAIADLRKHGREAKRWREYAFLFSCTLVAMTYGALNDQVTSAISWEYFYYGKELYKSLGPQTPPDAIAFHLAAAKVGISATWSAGLIIGVALLIANNPRGRQPPLSFPSLAKLLPLIFAITIGCSIVGAALGWFGLLNRLGSEFPDLWKNGMWRPRHFMATWGIHLGGYVGGILGTVVASIWVVRRRAARTPRIQG